MKEVFKTGMVDPNWKRLLPELKCPLCGRSLKELRMRGELNRGVSISWVCDCEGFEKIKKLAN